MRWIESNFQLLGVQLLPPHKRRPNRVSWIMGLLWPLEQLMITFRVFRRHAWRLKNVTSQVKLLEGYLRSVFAHRNISVLIYANTLVDISLEAEGQLLPVGNTADSYVSFSLDGEIEEGFTDADFVVSAPLSVPADKLAIEVNKYKQVDKTVLIKQQ